MKTFNKDFSFYYLKHLLEALYNNDLITLDEWQNTIKLLTTND